MIITNYICSQRRYFDFTYPCQKPSKGMPVYKMYCNRLTTKIVNLYHFQLW